MPHMKPTLRFLGGVPKLAAAGDSVAFEGCAYAGGIFYPEVDGLPAGFPVVFDLDSAVIPTEVRPVLDGHDQSTDGVIGETSEFRVRSDYSVAVKGVLHSEKPRTQEKILSAKRHRLSLGANGFTIERIEAGRSVAVNGQRIQGPVAVIRGAYVTDLSFVTTSGDSMTWARIAARRAKREADAIMPAVAANRSSTAPGDAIRREARRIAGIAWMAGDDDELYETAVKDGWSVSRTRDAAELKALRAGRRGLVPSLLD